MTDKYPYACSRCGSNDFAIDTIEDVDFDAVSVTYDVMCRNCGGYQGILDVNK